MRRLEVSFDDATGLARAPALAVQAMRIIQDCCSGASNGLRIAVRWML